MRHENKKHCATNIILFLAFTIIQRKFLSLCGVSRSCRAKKYFKYVYV